MRVSLPGNRRSSDSLASTTAVRPQGVGTMSDKKDTTHSRLYDAIKSQDTDSVRDICSQKPSLLERCAKFAAAPRLHAQFGYRVCRRTNVV